MLPTPDPTGALKNKLSILTVLETKTTNLKEHLTGSYSPHSSTSPYLTQRHVFLVSTNKVETESSAILHYEILMFPEVYSPSFRGRERSSKFEPSTLFPSNPTHLKKKDWDWSEKCFPEATWFSVGNSPPWNSSTGFSMVSWSIQVRPISTFSAKSCQWFLFSRQPSYKGWIHGNVSAKVWRKKRT